MAIQWIHISHDINNKCQQMLNTGRREELVVRRYQQLLADLRQYGPLDDRVFRCRTKKGEQRRNNCIKYDLGGGYRLVTIKEKQHLYLVFFGNHDETDTWFLRHGHDSLNPKASHWSHEKVTLSQPSVSSEQPKIEAEEDPYEAALATRIDESLLRYVFYGLTGTDRIHN